MYQTGQNFTLCGGGQGPLPPEAEVFLVLMCDRNS